MRRVAAMSAPGSLHLLPLSSTVAPDPRPGAWIVGASLLSERATPHVPACCRAAGCVEEGRLAMAPTNRPARWMCLCRRCRTAAAGTAFLLSVAQAGNAFGATDGAGVRVNADPWVVPGRKLPNDNTCRRFAENSTPGTATDVKTGAPGGVQRATATEQQEPAPGVGVVYIGAVGRSDVDDETLSTLQVGAHEPNRDGIPLHLLTLSGQAHLGPAVEVHASVMGRSTRGETGEVEVEEAYALVSDGRREVQWKIGRFFAEVGRLNAEHFEDADFVDKPVILARLFGEDQLSNEGLRMLWPFGADGDSTLTLGVQDSRGETASSFLAEADAEVGGHTLIERDIESAGDLLYHARWATSPHREGDPQWELGISAVTGPNASGSRTRTDIFGVDFSAAWNPAHEGDERGSVRWHTEFLVRRYEAGDSDDPAREILTDSGLVTQLLWAFRPRLTAGFRVDYATGSNDNRTDPERDMRLRTSMNVTWNPARAAALRFQYNRDSADHLDDGIGQSVWVQIRLAAGGHDEHH
jgi:hypothetical protein